MKDLSDKLKDYPRDLMLSEGFFCGTIDGFRYHASHREDPCIYCNIFIEKYTKEQNDSIKAKERRFLKEWREDNPELAKKFLVPAGASQQESEKIRMCEYRFANPEKFATYSRTRRAKKRMVASEPYSLQDIQLRHGIDCHICEEPIDYKAKRTMGEKGWESGLHLDHVVPISLGGSNTIENVKPSHGFCNASKGNKLVEEMGSMEIRKQAYLSCLVKTKR